MEKNLLKIPKNPAVTLDNHRFELPVSISIPWLDSERRAAFVPLHWKRLLRLPSSKRLEAWYLTDLEASEEWSLDPGEVIAGTVELGTDDLHEARNLIYPTTISFHNNRPRITVPKLLTIFAAHPGALAGAKIIISLEGNSLAVWTFTAFQTHFGSVGK